MNFNLPYILQNGMKVLNIVNKTLPLVKEFNPALGFIKKKLRTVALPNNINIKNTPTSKQPVRVNNVNNNNINNNINNNSLTFFR